MNKALKEALRTIPNGQVDTDSDALRQFKETVGIEAVDNEKWLIMPRKYTRSSARFGLPINSQELAKLTPFAYLSKHIWISAHRKQLYRYVFKKYLAEVKSVEATSIDADIIADESYFACNLTDTPTEGSNKQFSFCDHIDSVMSFCAIDNALIDVLGYCGPIECISEKIKRIKTILLLDEHEHQYVNFRSWCGIVAFAERYLNMLPLSQDPCDEVILLSTLSTC